MYKPTLEEAMASKQSLVFDTRASAQSWLRSLGFVSRRTTERRQPVANVYTRAGHVAFLKSRLFDRRGETSVQVEAA